MSSAIDSVLTRLEQVTRSGNGWKACCPAHVDQKPSLSVTQGSDGRVLLHCHAGCTPEQVVKAMDLTMMDLFANEHDGEKRHLQSVRLGVTLAELAAAKMIPVDFLQNLGVSDLKDGGVAIPYRDFTGEELCVKKRTTLAAKDGSYWPEGTPLMLYGLDKIAGFQKMGKAILVEGETDSWTGWYHGLPFLGLPGANTAKVLTSEVVDAFQSLYVIQEPDRGGDAFVVGISKRLAELGWQGNAYVVRLLDAKDTNDLYCTHPGPGEFAALFQRSMDVAEVLRYERTEHETNQVDQDCQCGVVSLSDIRPTKVDWLIPGIVPMGKLTLIAGNPGVAKSTLTLAIAAALSVGRTWPGQEICPAGNVLILSAEDGLSDTIVPRLQASGADLRKVLALNELPVKAGYPRPVILPDDIRAIQDIVLKRDVRLVIVDPLNAYLSGAVNSWKDADIRRALTPLGRMAEETSCALLLVAHLNKAAEQDALYRVGGSIALVAAARSAVLVTIDPNDEDRRLLVTLKNNLAKEPKSMAFRLEDTSYGAARIVFDGFCDLKAGDVLTTPEVSDEERGAIQDAIDFLKRQLGLGPVAQVTLLNYAKADGISERTLYRAKKALGVESIRVMSYGIAQWIWQLPTQMDVNSNIAKPYMSDLAMLDDIGDLGEDDKNEQAVSGVAL